MRCGRLIRIGRGTEGLQPCPLHQGGLLTNNVPIACMNTRPLTTYMICCPRLWPNMHLSTGKLRMLFGKTSD
jgi:hypothetical protein